MWNTIYSICVFLSSLLSAKKGKANQLNTKEIPCKVKIENEATIQGNAFVFNPYVSG